MPPATDWKEIIPEGENERFERFASLLAEMQQRHGGKDRALHAKQNLGLEASFEVLRDLPAECAVGLFATPGKFTAVARFSNGSPRRQSDRMPDVRGLAVKLFDVDGKKVIPGMEDVRTQDFLAIRTSNLPVRDAQEFLHLVRAAASPALLPFKLIGGLGLSRAFQVIRNAVAGLRLPQSPLSATRYFSALPVRFGPYAAQFAFTPQDPPAPMKLATPTQLGDDLTARLRDRPVVYDFQIRFYQDEQSTPIEDASVEWSTPWQTVGRLTLPVQDAGSPRGKQVDALVETLAFDPWHAREDLRPLGNMMRARNVAYRVSTKARGAAAEPAEAPRFE